jgi:hypothetical protein
VAEADGGTVSLFVMVANNSGAEARRLAATYPGRIGHLYGPGGWRGPFPEFPYALDNGAFPAFTKGTAWDEAAFLALCERAAGAAVAPRWVAVPDVVCDRAGTLAAWGRWSSILRERFGWPLAFVVQDGMTHEDVPDDAALLFVGGSTTWKQQTAAYWRERMPRVHIGRVNGERDLWRYHRAGAESCDGTGWFRGSRRQLDGLWYYLADSSGQSRDSGPTQPRLFALGEVAA